MIVSAHVNGEYKSLCRSALNHESFLSLGSVFLRICDVDVVVDLRFIYNLGCLYNSGKCFPFISTLVFNLGSRFVQQKKSFSDIWRTRIPGSPNIGRKV